VAPDEHKFAVHGHQLSKNSEFFTSALKNEWVEGQTRTVRLPQEDEEQMTHYLDFIHGHGLSTKHFDTFAALDSSPGADNSYISLFKLYVFGERMLDNNIQQAIIKEVVRLISLKNDEGSSWAPSGLAINLVYEGTTSSSPARRLLVDEHINFGQTSDLDKDLPTDYIRDIAKAFTGAYSCAVCQLIIHPLKE
jgi:hypothetical protein